MKWQIIDSGTQSAQEIMDFDGDLLKQISNQSSPILHLYEWEKPSLTYGYFINPEQFLNLKALERNNIQTARRPTGGGVIFHLTDFAFSIIIPAFHSQFSENTLENYRFVNKQVANSLSSLLIDRSIHFYSDCNSNQKKIPFCMAKPTQYDLIINEKKMGGAAQRKTKLGLLHQGSISLSIPSNDLLNEVLIDNKIIESMHQFTYLMLPQYSALEDIKNLKNKIKNLFIEYFSKTL